MKPIKRIEIKISEHIQNAEVINVLIEKINELTQKVNDLDYEVSTIHEWKIEKEGI